MSIFVTEYQLAIRAHSHHLLQCFTAQPSRLEKLAKVLGLTFAEVPGTILKQNAEW
jgi:hypothetical protein